MKLHKTFKGKKMKKLASTLICFTTYGLGQTSVLAHGGHGADTSLVHLFTEPKHTMGLIVAGIVLALIIALSNRLHTVGTKK